MVAQATAVAQYTLRQASLGATSHLLCGSLDDDGCVHICKVPKRNPAVVQNIEQLQGLASNQQEQYSSLQTQLSGVQDTQQSLEQRLQEATEVCCCNICWYIHTSFPRTLFLCAGVVSDYVHPFHPFL